MHDAANTKTASGELSRMATELERLVAQFKYDRAVTESRITSFQRTKATASRPAAHAA